MTLITHDWGAWLGYMLHQENPGIAQRVVSVDVGDPDWSLGFHTTSTLYQGYLLTAW